MKIEFMPYNRKAGDAKAAFSANEQYKSIKQCEVNIGQRSQGNLLVTVKDSPEFAFVPSESIVLAQKK